jgi:hypothetical protein
MIWKNKERINSSMSLIFYFVKKKLRLGKDLGIDLLLKVIEILRIFMLWQIREGGKRKLQSLRGLAAL